VTLWRPLAVLALAAPAALLLPATPASAACDVTVASFSFTPTTLTVAPGTTVTWCWTGDNHSVTADAGSFDSHPTCPATCGNTGYTYNHTFNAAGTFAYHCRVHTSSMKATITVKQPAPSPSTKPPATPTRTSASPSRTASPTPPRTTPPATTAPPSTTPPATTPATTPPVTSPPATTEPPANAAPSATAPPAALDPAPAKPRTGLAVAAGLAVAVLSLGGAAAVWLRSRATP
jgi:plastocyanin